MCNAENAKKQDKIHYKQGSHLWYKCQYIVVCEEFERLYVKPVHMNVS